jgi:hypothetical protein
VDSAIDVTAIIKTPDVAVNYAASPITTSASVRHEKKPNIGFRISGGEFNGTKIKVYSSLTSLVCTIDEVARGYSFNPKTGSMELASSMPKSHPVKKQQFGIKSLSSRPTKNKDILASKVMNNHRPNPHPKKLIVNVINRQKQSIIKSKKTRKQFHKFIGTSSTRLDESSGNQQRKQNSDFRKVINEQ